MNHTTTDQAAAKFARNEYTMAAFSIITLATAYRAEQDAKRVQDKA